jgi:protein phosphatase
MNKLKGRDVSITHGLAESLEQLDKETPEFRERVKQFLDALVSHYVLDDGRLVVAHAGMRKEMQGRGSGRVRDFALYGETTGETDEFGLPVRYNWAADYRGDAMVVYGHTPIPEPEWLNKTINIDTGCVFGGRLTALRYPERELISVDALAIYAEPVRPLPASPGAILTAQQLHDDLPDIEDVMGKRLISTRLRGKITVREENAAAALEVMSRFAVDPKWLIYLPPTMSPCETSGLPDLLEHPAEAFSYYLGQGVPAVICQEKHMGSRAVVTLCQSEEVARERFGVIGQGIGVVTTRTGRAFFDDKPLEQAVLTTISNAMEASGLWSDLETDWICLDCELMPWSTKAQELLRRQYAAVGSAATHGLKAAVSLLDEAEDHTEGLETIQACFQDRAEMADRFVAAYRRYCWPVSGIQDLKLAPFHLLAAEGRTFVDRTHTWHMEMAHRLCAADPTGLLHPTIHRQVELTDPASVEAGTRWWEELTARGGEGMVVKPLAFIALGPRGLMQPAVKCRGREYLRIIYGLEYTAPENLSRLRGRNVAGKRALALREFALGIEALERFVQREPLRRVHECVFGVLAMESEPIDPRL